MLKDDDDWLLSSGKSHCEGRAVDFQGTVLSVFAAVITCERCVKGDLFDSIYG